MGCSERGVVRVFRRLLFKSNKKKFSFRRVQSKKIAVVQEEICCRAFCKWMMFEWKEGEENFGVYDL